jgi:hypothetical protein
MINRRTFLKLAGAGLLSLLLPIRIKEQMELSDVWAKLANQARLTPEELDFLKMQGRETQQRNAFVAGNTSPQGTLITSQTLTPFYSTVLTIDTASITIEIPGGFKHIFLTGSGRLINNGLSVDHVNLIFNGDTGANYSYGIFTQGNTTLTGNRVTGYTDCKIGWFATDPEPSGYSGSFFAYIYNYNSSFYKQCAAYTVTEISDTIYSGTRHGVWHSTARINNLTISANDGQIQAGSTISVYGLT